MKKTLSTGRSMWLLVSGTPEWNSMAVKFLEDLSSHPLAHWRVQAGLVKAIDFEDFTSTVSQIISTESTPEQLVIACDPCVGMLQLSSTTEEIHRNLGLQPVEGRILMSEQRIESCLQALLPRIKDAEPSLAHKWLSSQEAYNDKVVNFDWMAMWGAQEEDEDASTALSNWAIRFRNACGGGREMEKIFG
jgi:hypothetical protein